MRLVDISNIPENLTSWNLMSNSEKVKVLNFINELPIIKSDSDEVNINNKITNFNQICAGSVTFICSNCGNNIVMKSMRYNFCPICGYIINKINYNS